MMSTSLTTTDLARAPESAFHRIPSEIILSICMISYGRREITEENRVAKDKAGRMLSQVCRGWREVIHQSSHFWTVVRLSNRTIVHSKWVELVEDHLALTAPRPLYLDISLYAWRSDEQLAEIFAGVLDVLQPSISRWVHLAVDAPACVVKLVLSRFMGVAPALCNLAMVARGWSEKVGNEWPASNGGLFEDQPATFPEAVDNLPPLGLTVDQDRSSSFKSELRVLMRYCTFQLPPLLGLAVTHLSVETLRNHDIRTIFSVLKACPNLLELDIKHTPRRKSTAPILPILLPSLVSLKLDKGKLDPDIFPLLRVPLLRVLHLRHIESGTLENGSLVRSLQRYPDISNLTLHFNSGESDGHGHLPPPPHPLSTIHMHSATEFCLENAPLVMHAVVPSATSLSFSSCDSSILRRTIVSSYRVESLHLSDIHCTTHFSGARIPLPVLTVLSVDACRVLSCFYLPKLQHLSVCGPDWGSLWELISDSSPPILNLALGSGPRYTGSRRPIPGDIRPKREFDAQGFVGLLHLVPTVEHLWLSNRVASDELLDAIAFPVRLTTQRQWELPIPKAVRLLPRLTRLRMFLDESVTPNGVLSLLGARNQRSPNAVLSKISLPSLELAIVRSHMWSQGVSKDHETKLRAYGYYEPAGTFITFGFPVDDLRRSAVVIPNWWL
ncbi:hypothetical protein BOTBODRAFT_32185 [Botryobasidium botryosum FD-172 SS1]|uniref:F-box domain-containing protein n=1 Tax=Botryobasidium botryosum (strain FD-172 SS1) TaxID=930990 RepID=A0A067MH50_BOTB1|nr:hypothetical protein BOTBODRAFT_32185 [Botryobasidium botryosum FD-172 SS1]